MLAAAVFAAGSAMAQFDPMQPIPADKEVRTGRLDNGLTYYIRHNEKPKGQADFYILHNVGAIQEEDDQQGLAHFLEHSCGARSACPCPKLAAASSSNATKRRRACAAPP